MRSVKHALDARVTSKFYIILRDDSCSKDPTILGWKMRNVFAMVCKYLHDCCKSEVAEKVRVSFICWRLKDDQNIVFSIDFSGDIIRYALDSPIVEGWEVNERGKLTT